MVATTPSSVPKYSVSYVGDPRSDAAIVKTLKHGGPLLLAQEHMAVKMLPGALDRDTYSPMVSVASELARARGAPGGGTA